jgi:hypothetical protein
MKYKESDICLNRKVSYLNELYHLAKNHHVLIFDLTLGFLQKVYIFRARG